MKRNYWTHKKAHFLMCLFVVSILSCKKTNPSVYERKVEGTALVKMQDFYTLHLNKCIADLNALNTEHEMVSKRAKYKKARTEFKKIEPILAFVDSDNYKSLNAPNITKVEEEDLTDIKVVQPFGFQVIEELLYEDDVDLSALQNKVQATIHRLLLVKKNNTLFLKTYHVLWLIRNQIARIGLVGITGFDSPVLEASLPEAITNYATIHYILKLYKQNFSLHSKLLQQWEEELSETKKVLSSDFESFDRYDFIKNHAHKQLELLKATAEDWKVTFPLTMAFQNNITSLFSKETFNMKYFSDYHYAEYTSSEKNISLGKKLFNDKSLSKDKLMSCATCHIKDQAFTDGKKIAEGQTRNTPPLAYAALQKSFFYDGRAGSLEGQIVGVVENEKEFHTDLKSLTEAVQKDSTYIALFKENYKEISNFTIRNAMANYIRSLGDFSSKFDRNINKKESTLTTSEIKGFNLFMGKAKCATCHFPPVFNGTVPPDFKESELEALGTPNPEETKLSQDLGRYYLFGTEERKHFFKTPTIRNIGKTAPYMHNGVYSNLKQVIDFYNKGGGVGLGYHLPSQTLPPDPLELSDEEVQALIAFMETLTDS